MMMLTLHSIIPHSLALTIENSRRVGNETRWRCIKSGGASASSEVCMALEY